MKKELLFIIPSLVGGGAERALINLLKKMDYSKYIIDVCLGVNKGEYRKEIPQEVRKVFYLFKNSLTEKIVVSLLHRDLHLSFVFKVLANKKMRGRYDVGISFLDSSWTDMLLFKEKEIKSKMAWVHSSYATNTNFYRFTQGHYRKNRIERYHKMDKIIFVSQGAKNDFTSLFGETNRMEVVYNLISPTEVIRKSNEKTMMPKEHFCFIAVGSLYPVKGYDRLIQAAKMLKEDGFRFTVCILGKGYLYDQLADMIRQLGLSDTVFLEGFKANPYPYIKNADVFMITSTSEALPTVLCEAMILGKPVIATDCCGCREIIDEGRYGLMVEQNGSSIYEAMKKMITSDFLRKRYMTLSRERSCIFNDDEILSTIETIIDTI